MEEIGAADMATAVTLSVHILSQYPVVTWGTDEQRERWLGPMVAGEALGAFALTEPHAGSDAAAIRTRAERVGPADAPEGYRLTGTKIWITNAPGGRPLPRLRDARSGGRLEGDHRVPRREGDGRVHVRRPREEDGDPGLPGGGARLRRAASCRSRTGSARKARATGSRCPRWPRAGSRSRRRASGWPGPALEQAAAYLGQRKAFGGVLAEQQGLRFMLAEMARDVEAARALTRQAAAAKDRGEPIGVASSLAKWTASDTAMRVATDAVQLFGASGYSRETGIERLMRDAKGAQIYEGTNQIHRLIVADDLLSRLSGCPARRIARSATHDPGLLPRSRHRRDLSRRDVTPIRAVHGGPAPIAHPELRA